MTDAMTKPLDLDWTRGGTAVVYQCCGACQQRWYFKRDFCPACGDREPTLRASDGFGTVHACTLVHRAPSDAFRKVTPYALVLVDLDEGVRLMGHADVVATIGARVRASIQTIAGHPMPYFELKDSA